MKVTEKILQFGEGNFLRAFIDAFVDKLNQQSIFNGSIVVIQPIEAGMADLLNAQNGDYTVLLRGLEHGMLKNETQKVTAISRALNPYSEFAEYMDTMQNPDLRYVVSNTTEAGIQFLETDKLDDKPAAGFPGKITQLLLKRFEIFNGDPAKGFIFIPCELIDDNGAELKKAVLQYARHWHLPETFITWVETANYFTNTLVDRIVTGYPKDEIASITAQLGYEDKLVVTGEIFHFFAIEASGAAKDALNRDLPFALAGLNVVVTDDVTPYKLRKVRILNGAHTMSVLAARLAGFETVGEMMKDDMFLSYINQGIYNEIIPTLSLPKADLESFAASVSDRFSNPFIKHYLLSIALNSVSKFKARVLPTIIDYIHIKNALPKVLTFSFAALIEFYGTNEANDDADIVAFFSEEHAKVRGGEQSVHALVAHICANTLLWGQDLNALPHFTDQVVAYLCEMNECGIECALTNLLGDAYA